MNELHLVSSLLSNSLEDLKGFEIVQPIYDRGLIFASHADNSHHVMTMNNNLTQH